MAGKAQQPVRLDVRLVAVNYDQAENTAEEHSQIGTVATCPDDCQLLGSNSQIQCFAIEQILSGC